MSMLREGAREVVALELDENFIRQGRFVRESIEWADNIRYNLRHVQGSMADLPAMGLGKFDLVLALCCLYYLDDRGIRSLVGYISTITEHFVVQCNINTSIPREDPERLRLASVAYNLDVLRSSGFQNIRVIAPVQYDRPLIVASK